MDFIEWSQHTRRRTTQPQGQQSTPVTTQVTRQLLTLLYIYIYIYLGSLTRSDYELTPQILAYLCSLYAQTNAIRGLAAGAGGERTRGQGTASRSYTFVRQHATGLSGVVVVGGGAVTANTAAATVAMA